MRDGKSPPWGLALLEFSSQDCCPPLVLSCQARWLGVRCARAVWEQGPNKVFLRSCFPVSCWVDVVFLVMRGLALLDIVRIVEGDVPC